MPDDTIVSRMALRNGVRHRMLELGISYDDLAAEVGVSLSTMRRIVCGEIEPRLETALRIAAYLECDADDLFFLSRG